MKRALFPGTFDPPTLGHVDILERAAELCDALYIGVAAVTSKQPLFSLEERIEFVQSLTTATVVPMSGLAVDLAKELNVDYLLRSLRAFSDFEHEFQMALANRKLTEIETLFLMSSPHLSHVSSSLIREIGTCGGDLSDFVPPAIEPIVKKRLLAK